MAKGGKAAAVTSEGSDPAVLLKSYQVACKGLGIKPEPSVISIINGDGDEKAAAPDQMCIDSAISPAGVRAIAEALLGSGNPANSYKLINSLRFWRCNARDAGTHAIAKLLCKQAEDSLLKHLQMMDCRVGAAGCGALGDALSIGYNKYLTTLLLDYNDMIASPGVKALCRGLRSNSTLKRLSLSHCAIDADGGKPLANLLKFKTSALEDLNLQGNMLEGLGLQALSAGLGVNKTLLKLNLSNNAIDCDVPSLMSFASAMGRNKTLTHLALEHNGIEERGAQCLVDSEVFSPQKNTTLVEMSVDIDLPEDLFMALMRSSAGGGGKKKKGGKKGGKKGKGKKK